MTYNFYKAIYMTIHDHTLLYKAIYMAISSLATGAWPVHNLGVKAAKEFFRRLKILTAFIPSQESKFDVQNILQCFVGHSASEVCFSERDMTKHTLHCCIGHRNCE